jgi:hypothetical protein
MDRGEEVVVVVGGYQGWKMKSEMGAVAALQLSAASENNRSNHSSGVHSGSIDVYFGRFIYLATLGGFSRLSPQVALQRMPVLATPGPATIRRMWAEESRAQGLEICIPQCKTKLEWK